MEIQSTLDRVSTYNELYDEVLARVGDKDLALSLIQEAAKDRRTEIIGQRETRRVGAGAIQNGGEATPKQIGWLKSRGADIPEGLSKIRASEMIDEIKANKSE